MMATNWPMHSAIDLQKSRILVVEDGNHGEYRPLKEEFTPNGVPFIRPGDLRQGRVDFDRCDRINSTAVNRVRKGKGGPDDVLFTHRATVGRIAYVCSEAPEFVANPGVTIWRSTAPEVLHARYLYYYMHSTEFMDQVWAEAGGTDTFPYISLTQQKSLSIRVPVIEIQQAVAAVLGALDDKIEHNRRIARKLEGLAKATFRAWFVDFEPVKAKAEGATSFPSMPQHVFDAMPAHFVDSDIAPIPGGWETKSLSAVCSLVGGGTPKRSETSYWGGRIPWYSVRDAPGDGEVWIIETIESITDEGLVNSAARLIPKGGTIISARGTVGRLAMAGKSMAFNQSCYGLLPNDGQSFCHLHLLMQTAVAELQQRTHGSVFDTITRTTFDGLMLPSPPGRVVSSFEEVVAPLFETMLSLRQESIKLAEMRDYLLPRLLNGSIRVGVANA